MPKIPEKSVMKEIKTIEDIENQTRITTYEGSNISKVVHHHNNNVKMEDVLYALCMNWLRANKLI